LKFWSKERKKYIWPCSWACRRWLAHQKPKLFYVLWKISSPCHCFSRSKL